MSRRFRFALVALVAALFGSAQPCHAAGALKVDGAGNRYKWTTLPIPFNIDPGTLGSVNHGDAGDLVEAAFAVWEAVSTATISYQLGTALPVDVTPANVGTYVGKCGDGLNPVVFDADGSITDALLGANASNNTLGFANPECVSGTSITEASLVLNGKWRDGIENATNPEIAPEVYAGVVVHEVGHFSGLDHTQTNRIEGLDADGGNDTMVATMFPRLVRSAAISDLNLDDIASVSALYPTAGFASATGSLSGIVRKSNGTTAFGGAWVTARQVGNGRLQAVGAVSGARSSFFGPTALVGLFEIPGLPPGDYTIDVENVDPGFTGGSRIGGFTSPQQLAGRAEFWNDANEAGTQPPDDPAESVAVTLAAGGARNDIDLVLDAPANDECNFSIHVTTLPFTTTLDTRGATTRTNVNPIDPNQTCTIGGASQNAASVFYRVDVPASYIEIDTIGSDYDTVMTLHSPTDCQVIGTQGACSDDIGPGNTASRIFTNSFGGAFRLIVTGKGGGGTLQINMKIPLSTPTPTQTILATPTRTATRTVTPTATAATPTLTPGGAGTPTPLPTPTAVLPGLADPLGKAAVKCAGAIGKTARAGLAKTVKQLDGCFAAVLACVESKPGDQGCLDKARTRCESALASFTLADAALAAAVQKKCGVPLTMTELLIAAGLDFTAANAECSGTYGIPLVAPPDVAACVAAQHRCLAGRLATAANPRGRGLLTVVNLAPDAAACLADLGGSGGAVGDPDLAKATTKCGAGIRKAAATLAGARLKGIAACTAAIFKCVQTKALDAACIPKASAKCQKDGSKIVAAGAKLTAALTKACGAVDFTTLAGDAGLDLAALGATCQTLGAALPATLADYGTCLLRHHECVAGDLLDRELPRTAELLGAAGLTPASCP